MLEKEVILKDMTMQSEMANIMVTVTN